MALQSLVQAVMIDPSAFKLYATKTDAKGGPMLTPPEKTLIENVIRNFNAKQPASASNS
jgi:hypothetical protein